MDSIGKAVTPLKNGIQDFWNSKKKHWIPASAGMTEKFVQLRS